MSTSNPSSLIDHQIVSQFISHNISYTQVSAAIRDGEIRLAEKIRSGSPPSEITALTEKIRVNKERGEHLRLYEEQLRREERERREREREFKERETVEIQKQLERELRFFQEVNGPKLKVE
ncbi:hypothetical protein HK097_000172 [Rhizophlyctis rosea]|uniref:Uncharacterized protein n=1 Tax=Rhizophlyctis rosea TaxID=64517 RepID=A0AAD5S8I1_9FUNG|nr:hypothetical protein HK097_000172 [Rhizophlyctis rosea]